MEFLALFGIILGLASIAIAHLIEGSTLLSLLNLPALIIVVGGTLSAIIVQTPKHILKRSFTLSQWFLYPPQIEFESTISKVVFWSKQNRKNGLLSIENEIDQLKDPFLRKGAELLVSGLKKETFIEIMEYEIDTIESRDQNAAKVFESMGGYTPTLGILGAVLGLIQVMNRLEDPTELGAGIAVAFVATIYGVGIANLILLPLANRLKLYIFRRTRFYEMYLAGLVSLFDDENPHVIEIKMKSFISHKGIG